MKCRKCKGYHGGGAVCRQGKCESCETTVSSACGGLPKLCKICSDQQSRCIQCGNTIKVKL